MESDMEVCARRALTDGERAAKRKVAAAGELPVLVLSQDRAQRPVARDDADVQPRVVAARADDCDHPAQSRAVGRRPADSQQQQLDERHEKAGDVEALALDLLDRARDLAERDAARLHELVAVVVRQPLKRDYAEQSDHRERREVLEQELV